MNYPANPIAITLFVLFVIFVLGISKYFAKRTRSSEGYFAAGGNIHWGVNGIAFAGDYLSAASFLGICGMIAFYGYDGFLYSIGYLAGWVVALFVVAEPMKRLGKYTFTDALDSKFNSKGIQFMAAVSTLIVSMCYLIPQMVGAGALVTPLLGLPHWAGVIMVGAIVIFIVATAGMASTTYVQFLKGSLLIIFSTVLVICLFVSGLKTNPEDKEHTFKKTPLLTPLVENGKVTGIKDNPEYKVKGQFQVLEKTFVKIEREEEIDVGRGKVERKPVDNWWYFSKEDGKPILEQCLSVTKLPGTEVLYNGAPKSACEFYSVGNLKKIVFGGKEVEKTGSLNPFSFLSTIEKSQIIRYKKLGLPIEDGQDKVTLWYPSITSGKELMKPGMKFKIDKGGFMGKLNFISLMLALFFGTSALPHILIRYYTVPSQKDARKSTIVAIAAIGFFYILTLYMGLGAMVSGVLDVQSSNMSAPLLAKYFGIGLFAVISAIAFATVLGTVSGLIVAASGAVAHDLMDNFLNIDLSDSGKVKAGKIAAFAVGIIAIFLGIIFKGMNVSFLVGWAFAVAASANLPAILMLLFWKKTNAKGITASVLVGMVSAIVIILLSPSMWEKYGLPRMDAPCPLDNPGIISIPLSFITLIVVSLLTQKKEPETAGEAAAA